MIFGNLYVQDGIDPTYLALTPQPSGPTGFTNPLWVDNSGFLRSEKIKIEDTNNDTNIINLNGMETNKSLSLIGGTTTTITSANNLNILSSEENINLTATNNGTYAGEVFINKQNPDTGDGILNVGTIKQTNAITLQSPNYINLDTPNFNAYTYAMPICFSLAKTAQSLNYTLGTQHMEEIFHDAFNIPYEFVALAPPPTAYTSSKWKIEVAFNCYSSTNLNDKGIAMYMEFEDVATTVYAPVVYNKNFPYAVWQNGSTYIVAGAGTTGFQNFNWTDHIDFAGLYGTGAGNLPLLMRFFLAGDTAFTADYNLLITLTKTNLV